MKCQAIVNQMLCSRFVTEFLKVHLNNFLELSLVCRIQEEIVKPATIPAAPNQIPFMMSVQHLIADAEAST